MKSTTFQLVVSALFVFFLIVGVGTFAIFTSGGAGGTGEVEIWGSADQRVMDAWIGALRQSDDTFDGVTYRQVPAASFDATVVDAIASGRGPDLLLLSEDKMVFFADKVLTIPYSSYSEGDFNAAFVDEGRIFLTPEGARALPVMIDPLMMYWNRDIFAAAGIANPPQYWNDLLAMAPQLTQLDASQGVVRSAAAMGTWRNVQNAKPLLATLMLQAGDPIVSRSDTGELAAALGMQGGAESPAASALRFYTEFANPAKNTYSWNGSLPNSTNAFLAGDAALYFGFASELETLRARNPNLRFDVGVMPQLRQGTPATFGRITGAAVSRGASNPQGALAVAAGLSGPAAAAALAGVSPLPSVRRDAPADTSASAAAQAFGRSALIARGWLDPGAASDVIFKDMIESVLSGRSDPSQAVFDAAAALRDLVDGKQ